MVDPTQFVTAVAAKLSPDGKTSVLVFKLANGKENYVQFPTGESASLMLNLEQALGTLFEQQRKLLKGADPRELFAVGAKRVSKIQGAVSTTGDPVVSFVLDTGVRLDFALGQTALPELIAWLKELEAVAKEKPSARH
jgi:hypothetical protein